MRTLLFAGTAVLALGAVGPCADTASAPVPGSAEVKAMLAPLTGPHGGEWPFDLDHDAYEAFVEAGGPYDKATARRLHDAIMQVGYSVDPAVAYRNFRGRDPEVGAYLRSKGFPVHPAASAPAKTAQGLAGAWQ